MKKVLMAAVAALTMLAFTGCDENAEHCYEVTTTTAGVSLVSYSRMTKEQAEDAEALGTNGLLNQTTKCKIVANSNCEAED
ncbi:MAG: hypothetical protein J5808_01410 [Paludibacteraceae bacterium]|nr:hypothetical protein [Paludibacteraceae bacterium]